MGLFDNKTLINQKGEKLKAADVLADKEVVLVYFSAHWCPPCKHFTPVLKDMYEELQDQKIAIIFVSSDRTEEEMMSYFTNDHGDYYAVPFNDQELMEVLKKTCAVRGIPKLALINPEDGSQIHGECRGDVTGKSPMENFKEWCDLAKK